MNCFFTNILSRNSGTSEVVMPRPLARFEPEGAVPAIKSTVDHTEAGEIGGDELTRQDSVVRSSENKSVVSDLPLSQPKVISPAGSLPVGLNESDEKGVEHLPIHDRQFRPATNSSVEPEVNLLERDDHFSTPLFQEQDKPIIKPKPAEQVSQGGEDTARLIVHQQSEEVTVNQLPLSEDLPKPIVEQKLKEEVNEHTTEIDYHFENEVDKRIRTTLARLQARQKVRPTEHPEIINLPGPEIIEPDHPDAPRKNRTVQPLSSKKMFDELEKVGPSILEPGQQRAIALPDRDIPGTGSLEPPFWLSEIQTEFNRRWNALNSKSEPEPVINVTIGRVEVRAVQAEPPKQTSRKKKPTGVMSLDEYLTQRNRRG